ncbi:MAG TPA: hypothetical protein VGZ25_00685 [Gemmataceae bacterium]|nr:hypothetical protein [Gemmataceae bacterium]
MDFRKAGNSLIAFGSAILLTSIIFAFITGGFIIDLMALFVIVLGLRVSDSSRRATKWAAVIMAMYLFSVLFAIAVATIRPDQLRFRDQLMSPWAIALAIGFLGIFAFWSSINIGLLARLLRDSKRSA